MKILGLCSLLLSVFVLSAPAQDLLSAAAQDSSKAPLLTPDKDVRQEWLAHAAPAELAKSDRPVIIWRSNPELGCLYMRTYRVERESRDSDVTRPAGYTKCVPMNRFTVERAVEQRLEPEPAE
jgi:hypothetical protein